MAAKKKRDRIRISRRGAYALNAKLAKLGPITLREMKRRAGLISAERRKARAAALLEQAAS